MQKEFPSAFDLSTLGQQPELDRADEETVRKRYQSMCTNPEEFAHSEWISQICKHSANLKEEGVVLHFYRDEESVRPEDLFKHYIERVGKHTNGLFGVKPLLASKILQSESGFLRYRQNVIAACVAVYPSPHNQFEPFTVGLAGSWMGYYPQFVRGMVTDPTTDELARLGIEERVIVPEVTVSDLILP